MFAQSNTYGLPENIQDGNILHCFNWSINDVKNNLASIAEAGFGAVQLSPMQRKSATANNIWYDLYRPYDYCFTQNQVLGSKDDLKNLCAEAHKYGIKVIVDVVANHVDKTTGYHDTWWDSKADYVRSKGGNANINYGNRYSITHDRLGDYYELNTSNSEVIARAKAYIQELKDCGVDGCRWDAAKHIELPSEGSQFWAEVTSVPGMFHYGEILGTPGPNNNEALIAEYAKYMSVTDSNYSDDIAKNNNGVPDRRNGQWAPLIGSNKVVYWGESHDTFSNTPDFGGWSNSKSQALIDKAYASVACRDGATALYLSRPNTTNTGQMKIVKGSDNYKIPSVAEVNKFRNKMHGRKEWFSTGTNCMSVTRNNGGAVIVTKSNGATFTVENGGGFCPAGTYTDRVSGNTITVTASTISGKSGDTGIVVIYNDNLADPDPNAPDQEFGSDKITVYYDNSTTNWTNVSVHYWGGSSETTWPGVTMTAVSDDYGRDLYKVEVPAGSNGVFNNKGAGQQTVNCDGLKNGHIYKGTTTTSNGQYNVEDTGIYGQDPNYDPDHFTIYFDNTQTAYTTVYCYYWNSDIESSPAFPGAAMTKVDGNIYKFVIPSDAGGMLFAQGDKAKQTVDVTDIEDGRVYIGLADTDGNKNLVQKGDSFGSVDNVTIDKVNFTVTVSNSTMFINGLNGELLLVAGIDGRLYYQGYAKGEISLPLSPGVYIANVAGNSVKVNVR